MNGIKVWPHLTIVAVVVALIAGFGVALYLRHEQMVEAESLPNAARIQRVDGEVAFSDGVAKADGNQADTQWVAATANQPFSVGDQIYTRDNAHTSLAFSGRNFARLNPNTSLDVVSLGRRRTQLALRDGSAMFDVGYLEPNEVFEVATPYGAVDFHEPGLYDVGFDNNGNVLVSVLSGLARVVGQGGSGNINKGEMLTLVGQAAAQLALSRLNGDDAGSMVDDYYRHQYPDAYDGRYNNYDAYLKDPNYYDPYRRDQSYKYASSTIPGINDLGSYGDWQNIDGYGQAWKPRVDAGWVPYQQGTWTNDYPYGPTWVSSEPWGYAPYHYGRWANQGNQWYWIPDAVNTTPTYAPALVAFVPVDDVNQIGWVPLGPGEAYAPRFYDDNWQPQYLTGPNLAPPQLMNLAIPGAVTVVPLDAFGRAIDTRTVRRIDQQRLSSARSTFDPLTVTPLRNAVMHSAWGRGKIDLPPGIAKKLWETPVFVGSDPGESRFRKDLAKSMRVERVSDKSKNEKFKVRDERHEWSEADKGRKQDEKEFQRQALDVEHQQKRFEKEQKKEGRNEDKGQRVPRGEWVGAPAIQRAQGENGRPEMIRVRPEPARSEAPNRDKHEGKHESQGADKHERKQESNGHDGGEDHGGGKGKGKG